jgi:hypothetical protein
VFGSSTGTLCPLFRRLALASLSPPALGEAPDFFLVVAKGVAVSRAEEGTALKPPRI